MPGGESEKMSPTFQQKYKDFLDELMEEEDEEDEENE